MKVDLRNVAKNSKGWAEITIDDLEDFWCLANIIRVGDLITSKVRRKVVKVSSTGKADPRQTLTVATISVTEVDFQPGVNEMQVRGKLTHDLEDAGEGSFQRVLLEPGRAFKLTKECWDEFTYEEITEAANPIAGATVAAVMMQSGLAHICIVGRNITIVKEKISKSIPKVKAHGDSGGYMEAKQKFFQMTAEALMRRVNVSEMRCIIVASPGFLQKEFVQYLTDNQAKYNLTADLQAKKFVECNSPSGYPHDLEPILAMPEMQSHVTNLKAAKQAKAIDSFLKTMNREPEKILMGKKKVMDAGEAGAIETLLVTDMFILSQELSDRLAFLQFKDRMENGGTEVIVFSTRHQSGEQLRDLGGIAAILRFSMHAEETGFDDEESTVQ